MGNVYGYCRGSTDGQKLTAKSQAEMIQNYVKMKGMDFPTVIADEATTSKIPLTERKFGGILCRWIDRGEVTDVIIAAFDRAFRNVREALATIEKWDKKGVALHILDCGGASIDTKTATGKFMFTVLAAMAEWERNRIAERTSESLRSAQKNGKLVCSPSRAPYGYFASPDPSGEKTKSGRPAHRLISCGHEQMIIGKMRLLHEEGMKHYSIAKWLNSAGFRPRNKGEWSATTVARILKREVG